MPGLPDLPCGALPGLSWFKNRRLSQRSQRAKELGKFDDFLFPGAVPLLASWISWHESPKSEMAMDLFWSTGSDGFR